MSQNCRLATQVCDEHIFCLYLPVLGLANLWASILRYMLQKEIFDIKKRIQLRPLQNSKEFHENIVEDCAKIHGSPNLKFELKFKIKVIAVVLYYCPEGDSALFTSTKSIDRQST